MWSVLDALPETQLAEAAEGAWTKSKDTAAPAAAPGLVQTHVPARAACPLWARQTPGTPGGCGAWAGPAAVGTGLSSGST